MDLGTIAIVHGPDPGPVGGWTQAGSEDGPGTRLYALYLD